MKKIGMLVAVEIEALLGRYGTAVETRHEFGFDVYKYQMESYELYAIHSGAGEVAAAAATQMLIAVYGVSAIINFGVVGGLTEEMGLAKTVVVERVIHYDFDISAFGHAVGQYSQYPDIYIPLDERLIKKAHEIAPELVGVTCASGDKFVDGLEAKSKLARDFGADICEMELGAIALICDRCKVPCLAIKTVSDAIDGGAEEFETCVNASADICLKITDKIIAQI